MFNGKSILITGGTGSFGKKSPRSLYATMDPRPGDALTSLNLRAIYQGGGLPPKYLELALGRTVTRPVRRGPPFDLALVLGDRADATAHTAAVVATDTGRTPK